MSGAIDAAHLEHQRAWSTATFGPPEVRGPRGPLAHARKELDEVAEDPSVLEEWVDVVILAFDGALRAGHEPQAIIDAVKAKQAKNERREWPDWRGVPVDQPIEHKRHLDPCPDAQQAAQAPVSRPNAAPVDSGAIGRLSERQTVDALLACLPMHEDGTGHVVDCGYDWDATTRCGCYTLPERLAAIVREHTERALAEERDRWIARLAHLCDDVWLRNRDRAMDLPDSKTQRWMRRGSSAWEQAANAVRSVLNDLANYDEEYVERHASYMTWLRNGRDRDELRAARQEQNR